EATFTRNILGPKLKAWASKLKNNQVDFYNESLDMYQQSQAGGGAYSASGYASVTEFHLDAASAAATGGHVIINAKYSPDKNDLAIGKVLEKYVGLWGSSKPTGTFGRSDLLNCNVFSNRGISYRLVELGFITNANDVKKLVDNIDAVAKELVEAITGESLGGSSSNNNSSSKPQSHDEAVAASKPTHQGNAWGKLDKFNVFTKDSARVAAWLVPDTPQGPIGKYAFVLVMEHGTNNELTRIQSKGIARPDVKKAYGYLGGEELGFDVTFNTDWMKGKKIDVILRRCNQANGEGAVNDVRISDIYLTL
ncbi:TPA: N-acetylmuramoyl-L-alanine amidase, partial [Enterococcus faecium]